MASLPRAARFLRLIVALTSDSGACTWQECSFLGFHRIRGIVSSDSLADLLILPVKNHADPRNYWLLMLNNRSCHVIHDGRVIVSQNVHCTLSFDSVVLCLHLVYIFHMSIIVWQHSANAEWCTRASARRYLSSAEYCHIEYWSVGPDEFPVAQ